MHVSRAAACSTQHMKINHSRVEELRSQIAQATYRPPFQLLTAAATFVVDKPELVLAEATTGSDSTTWRLIWLDGEFFGVATGTAPLGNWCQRTQDEPESSAITVELRRLSECTRLSYAQHQASELQWGGPGFEVVGALTLHFHDGTSVTLDKNSWSMTGDSDTPERFQYAVVERWSKLQKR